MQYDKFYEALFTEENGEYREGRPSEIKNYRLKTIRAGDRLWCEAFPILQPGPGRVKTAIEREKQRERQDRLNHKNSQKKVERLAAANFRAGDVFISLTYKAEPTEAQAQRDIRNYLARVRRFIKKQNSFDAKMLPKKPKELKYIYVTESLDRDGNPVRVHHHIILSGISRDDAENIWKKGLANSRRLQPDMIHGLKGITKYMTKNRRGARKFACSKNLTKPDERFSDKKLSMRRAKKVAHDMDMYAAPIFTKLYPDYDFVECQVKTSPYVEGAYIYAEMIRKTPYASRKRRGRGNL